MTDEYPGGQGRWSRSDFALARRAAREKWGVPDPLKTEALYQAAKMLADPEASHRDRLAASKLLLEADRHDLSEDKLVLDRPSSTWPRSLPNGSRPATPGKTSPTSRAGIDALHRTPRVTRWTTVMGTASDPEQSPLPAGRPRPPRAALAPGRAILGIVLGSPFDRDAR
jgi:hypothetical protein